MPPDEFMVLLIVMMLIGIYWLGPMPGVTWRDWWEDISHRDRNRR